jgi:glycerol-3-phosphate O-acyltransferase
MGVQYPGFAESTIFVAGDRVTTDMLAGPFSMGRNLLCIFSKKHIENPPERKSEKSKHNKNVMKKMKDMFKEGGKIIWVAPSGGRDRADESGRFRVAPFDPKSVEMFRLMGAKSGRKTHFYPLSMLTYPSTRPPPPPPLRPPPPPLPPPPTLAPPPPPPPPPAPAHIISSASCADAAAPR